MDPLPLGRCGHKNRLTKPIQCNRWAILVCSHCNQGVCSEHEKLHQQEMETRTDQLNNQINELRQILYTMTYEQMIRNLEHELDQWSQKCKNEIDQKQILMLKQGKDFIQRLNVEEFRSRHLNQIEQDIGQPLVHLLCSTNNIHVKHIERLELQLAELRNKMSFFQITDDGQIQVNQSSSSLPFSRHSLINCPGAMAGSYPHQNYLLIFQAKPCFSLVLFENHQQRGRTSIDDYVNDICWCQSMEIFLIATECFLYEFCPVNNRLSRTYENSKSNGIIWSLACHSTNLYVLHKPEMIMYQRDMKKSYEIKRKIDLLHESSDQTIGCIRIDQRREILALSIKQNDKQWRVDLFSINTLQRLYYGSPFHLFNENISEYCMLTPLLNKHHQWLVQNNQSILLDEQGQVIQQTNRSGYNLTLLGQDQIVFLDYTGVDICQR
ncbi:hypothetical protein I4U23_026907 [Adineta vaga]|nr:hypothetical protein I4U23_026907 [Adineta vaga]